jgi:RHS repeat-associated protein
MITAHLAAQCSNPTQVPNQTISSGTVNFTDNNALVASNVVINGSASVTFHAGNCIDLQPGFHATAGTAATTFHAWVDTGVPLITGLSVTFGTVGTAVTITGSSFGSSGTVTFNGTTATVTSWSAGSISVTVPVGAAPGSVNVVVTVSGVTSNAVAFNLQDSAPSDGTVTPSSGAGMQQTFVFTFSDLNGATDISWTQMDVGNASGTANSCVVFLGRGSSFGYPDPSTGGFWLEDDAGQGWSAPAMVGQPGTLQNSQCIVDAGASSLQLSGTNLTINVAVSFKNADIGAKDVWEMAVDNEGLASGGYYQVGTYTVTPPPSITSLSRTSGAVGTPVTISGSYFGASQGTVTFNGMPATVILNSWSAASIEVTVPDGATTGNVVVTTAGGAASNPVNFTVTTTTLTFDGRRVGSKSTGTYWGAAGEQIDLLSGNLNYSIPLIQAQGRAGMAATFALSYNSQIWRQTSSPNTSWLLGRDVGYGLGWTLQLGSIAPAGTYYIFTDASGAQYQLNGAAGNLWISQDGSYATYDATAQRLYFPDGSFWLMSVQSASGEPDAGTRYSSLIEDSNGNTIAIQYAQGAGGATTNTSGRITQITDSRATGSNASYTFTYNTDSPPHLTAITNSIGSTENYNLAYAGSQGLASPFDSTSFGTATLLQSVAFTDLNTSTGLQYVTGTAELNQVTTPAAGVLAWGYATHTYPGGESYREVQSRQMTSGNTLSPWSNSWTITRGTSTTLNLHPSATVADTGAGTHKVWNFQTASGPFFGLVTSYEEQNGSGAALLHKDYTWSQDGAGNVYIGAIATTLDPGQSYAATTTTQQTLDIYGNTTQTKLYDYGNPTTPARTYNYTYLSSSYYLNAYIRNRLTQATVTGSSGTVTLETDSYDGSSLMDRTGITAHDSAYSMYNGLRGNCTTTIQPGSTRHVSYDIGGMPVSADDGQGHSVTINPASGTNFAAPGTILPNGNSTYTSTYTYTPALQPFQATDPNNKTSTNTYDSYGRLLTSTTVTNMQTTYTYDYSQHTVSASAANNGWPIGTPSHWQRTTTDGFGRTIKTEAGADSNSILSVVDTKYAPCACSPLGKISKISQPYVSPATPVWTAYTYDASGRTLTVTAPDGVSVTSYTYQGNQTTTTDPAGKSKTYTYDASGNLLQVMEPGSLATLYTYDVLNHLTQVSMTRGSTTQTRTFTYDSLTQRLTQTTTPEAGTVQYSYNPDGTLQSKTDAMGQQTQYTYDSLARVTQVSYLPNGSEDLCQRVYYEYDNPHNDGTSANPIGRLTGMYWSGGPSCSYGFGEQYAYEAGGTVWKRVLQMTNGSMPGFPITLTSIFHYDAEGRLTVSQYPAATSGSPNATTTYTTEHDALGRPSHLYVGSPWQYDVVLPNTVTYNAAGQLTAMTTNAYTETRQYNANLQLIRLAAGGGQGVDLSYTYPTSGNNGRISQMTDNVTLEQVNYTYDVLNRLTQAGSMTFAYDGFGNLTQQGQTYLSIDANTNRINSAGYQYNANGNVTQTPGPATYSYDVANRLVLNGAIYNPRNQRVFDGTYIYLYTPEGKLAGRYTPYWSYGGSQALLPPGGQPNVYFGGKLIQEQGQWVMTDRLGSVRLHATNGRSSYQPYGAEVAPTSDQRTKFATYYRDSAGLDYAGQRYYSNVTGRFLTPDPGGMAADASDPGSWNRYAYVQGDPMNFSDRHGLIRDAEDCIDDPDACEAEDWGCYESSLLGVPEPGCYGGGGGEVPVTSGHDAGPKPSCDQLEAEWIDDYLQSYKGATGSGSPLYTGLATWGTPGVDAGTFLVNLADQTGVDPAFILGIARAESSLGTNPNVAGGRYNVYGNSVHFKSNRYTDYKDPTVDAFNLIENYIKGGIGLDARSMYVSYEGESKTKPQVFNRNLGALQQTDSALFGNLNNVRYDCNGFRYQRLAAALGVQ